MRVSRSADRWHQFEGDPLAGAAVLVVVVAAALRDQFKGVNAAPHEALRAERLRLVPDARVVVGAAGPNGVPAGTAVALKDRNSNTGGGKLRTAGTGQSFNLPSHQSQETTNPVRLEH